MTTKLSTLLPSHLAQSLADAASIDPHKALGLSAERTRVLDLAIAHIKRRYPHFFRKEHDPYTTTKGAPQWHL